MIDVGILENYSPHRLAMCDKRPESTQAKTLRRLLHSTRGALNRILHRPGASFVTLDHGC
jgi:hypothetical protein